MKIHITLSEYDENFQGNMVNIRTNLPDGSTHSEVTAVFNRALSALYGYNIGGQFFDDAPDNS